MDGSMSARPLHGDRSDRPARHTGRRANPSAWRTFFRGTSTLITRIITLRIFGTSRGEPLVVHGAPLQPAHEDS